MQRKRKLSVAKSAALIAALPFLLYAYEYGPDAGVAGVPGEAGTCNQNGCHTGTPVNGGGGSVAVSFPNGMTYTPGTKQHLVVTITDPAMKRWGFELTARTQSDTTRMAGSFSPTDQYTQLMCDVMSDLGIWTKESNQNTACPASQPLEYIEHTLAGYQLNQASPAQYSFDWNTPSTDVGPVTIYVAANAGPGGAASNLGCHIYTANYTLTSGSGGGSAPLIRSSAGVISLSGYGGLAAISPGSWIEIYGSNLAPGIDQWSGSDFNPNAPTSKDGVSVSIGGKPAFMYYLNPGQLDVLVPSDVPTGSQSVVVTTPSGASQAYAVTINTTEPGLLAPASLTVNGKQYVAALFSDNQTYALPNGAIAGLASRPAKAGDLLAFYGIGFGPTTPAFPAGVIVTQANQTTAPVQIMFGNTPVTPSYYGLVSTFTGLYEFVVTVPTVTANNALPLSFTLGGKKGSQTLYIAVQ
jgi:uncharacterized protein (TIGR03437 family)